MVQFIPSHSIQAMPPETRQWQSRIRVLRMTPAPLRLPRSLSPQTTRVRHSPTHAIAADDVDQGIDAQHWTAVYTMVGGDSTGAVPFTINFTDIATNPGVEVIAVTEGGGSVTFDKTAPTAPTAVTFSATGGTVTANTANTTNTNFVATSTITADQAVGGYAELLIDGVAFPTPILDSSIGAGETSVSFDAGLALNANVQTQLTDGGVLSVKVYDAAGNSAASTESNPTVTTDL